MMLIFVHERESQYQMEVLQTDKSESFCSATQTCTMGGKDTVLPEPLLKNQNVICLTYEQNTKKPYKDNLCLFRVLALHLHGNERLEEETSRISTFS